MWHNRMVHRNVVGGVGGEQGTDLGASHSGQPLMGWARMDDGFDDHPKVLALLDEDAGPAAVGLWTLCFAYANRVTRRPGKTPGLVPSSLPRRYCGPAGRELAALLVQVGLWEEHPDGWMFHDFTDYLPGAETSAKRAEAGRRGAAARWGSPAPVEQPEEWQDDGKLPFPDGNLPLVGHDVATDPMANDGSRASARRGPTPVPTPIPVPTKPSASRKRVTDDDPGFAAFWEAYPRRTDKGHARTAWAKAVGNGTEPELIAAGAREFATYCDRDGTSAQFIPHPATWLNGERWADERTPGATNGHRAFRNPEDPATAYDPGSL